MPALASLLRPVFGVQVSTFGQVVEKASGVLLVTEDAPVGDVEVGECELEAEGV